MSENDHEKNSADPGGEEQDFGYDQVYKGQFDRGQESSHQGYREPELNDDETEEMFEPDPTVDEEFAASDGYGLEELDSEEGNSAGGAPHQASAGLGTNDTPKPAQVSGERLADEHVDSWIDRMRHTILRRLGFQPLEHARVEEKLEELRQDQGDIPRGPLPEWRGPDFDPDRADAGQQTGGDGMTLPEPIGPDKDYLAGPYGTGYNADWNTSVETDQDLVDVPGDDQPLEGEMKTGAVQQMERQPFVPVTGMGMQADMDVYAREGQFLGTVASVRERDFLLNRARGHNLYVPFDALLRVGKRVVIDRTPEEIDHQDWEKAARR